MVGSLGGIAFECSRELVKTFDSLNFKRAAKYAEHEIHGRKNLLEFVSLAPTTASLSVELDAFLGVDVKTALVALRDLLKQHKVVDFVLDGEPQGDGRWVIESLDESHELVDKNGATVSAVVNINLKEYV